MACRDQSPGSAGQVCKGRLQMSEGNLGQLGQFLGDHLLGGVVLPRVTYRDTGCVTQHSADLITFIPCLQGLTCGRYRLEASSASHTWVNSTQVETSN